MKAIVCAALVSLVLGQHASPVHAEQGEAFGPVFPNTVPLTQTAAGSFTLTADLDGVSGEFLLDTGASMVTINRELFDRVRRQGGATPSGRVGARLASGKIEVLEVYEVASFRLGADCDLGPQKVAVMKRGGRNLLGMSVLSRAAPFSVSTAPPALGLSRCGQPGVAAR